jgi:hypothetical protein
MSQPEAQTWWAEVEHLREPLEQSRAERLKASPTGARRSVTIRGQAVPGAPVRSLYVVDDATTDRSGRSSAARRRPPQRPAERLSARPDSLAAWAVALMFLVVIIAALTAHG